MDKPPRYFRRSLGSVHIYAAMGVLPVTVAFTEVEQALRRSPDLARRMRRGAALDFTSSQGEQVAFRQERTVRIEPVPLIDGPFYMPESAHA